MTSRRQRHALPNSAPRRPFTNTTSTISSSNEAQVPESPLEPRRASTRALEIFSDINRNMSLEPPGTPHCPRSQMLDVSRQPSSPPPGYYTQDPYAPAEPSASAFLREVAYTREMRDARPVTRGLVGHHHQPHTPSRFQVRQCTPAVGPADVFSDYEPNGGESGSDQSSADFNPPQRGYEGGTANPGSVFMDPRPRAKRNQFLSRAKALVTWRPSRLKAAGAASPTEVRVTTTIHTVSHPVEDDSEWVTEGMDIHVPSISNDGPPPSRRDIRGNRSAGQLEVSTPPADIPPASPSLALLIPVPFAYSASSSTPHLLSSGRQRAEEKLAFHAPHTPPRRAVPTPPTTPTRRSRRVARLSPSSLSPKLRRRRVDEKPRMKKNSKPSLNHHREGLTAVPVVSSTSGIGSSTRDSPPNPFQRTSATSSGDSSASASASSTTSATPTTAHNPVSLPVLGKRSLQDLMQGRDLTSYLAKGGRRSAEEMRTVVRTMVGSLADQHFARHSQAAASGRSRALFGDFNRCQGCRQIVVLMMFAAEEAVAEWTTNVDPPTMSDFLDADSDCD